MKNKKLVWEHYKDPIAKGNKRHPLDGDGDEPYFNQFESEDEEEGGGHFHQGELGDKVIMTELGPLGINKRKLMTNQVSMWLLHTNFTITNRHLWEINKISGVEILKPLSRYKLLVGVGSLFDCEITKRKITAKLTKSKTPYSKLDVLAKEKFKHYAILSDGKPEATYELLGGDTILDVENKILELGDGWNICKKL